MKKINVDEFNNTTKTGKKFITSEDFSRDIITLKAKDNDSTILELIDDYCNSHSIEIESIVPYISQKLQLMIEEECEHLHLISKSRTRQLPI